MHIGMLGIMCITLFVCTLRNHFVYMFTLRRLESSSCLVRYTTTMPLSIKPRLWICSYHSHL